jgi:non-lysosomal glucosylceramidase
MESHQMEVLVNDQGDRESKASGCSCNSISCSGMERRAFLKTMALGTAASLAPRLSVMAGPFEASDFAKQVPADKKLDPAWVRS